MTDSSFYNFIPTTKCPNCDATVHPAISGWGRVGLNVRFKTCYKCGSDYHVVVYVEVKKIEEIDSDGFMSTLRNKIKYLRKKREEKVEKLLDTLEQEQYLDSWRQN